MPNIVGRSPSGGLIYEREDGSRFEIPRGSVDRLGLEVPEAAAAPDDFSAPVSDPATYGAAGGRVQEAGGELQGFSRALPEDNPVVDVQVDPEPLPQPPGQPEAPPNAGQPSLEELGIDASEQKARDGGPRLPDGRRDVPPLGEGPEDQVQEETPGQQRGQVQSSRVSVSRPTSSRGALERAGRAADRVAIAGANVVEDEAGGAQEIAEAGRETLDASEAVGRRKAEVEGFQELEKAKVDRAAAERAAEIQKEFVEEAQQQMQRVQEAVEVANTPIDPERLWNEASAPRKVSAALGAFLGGLLIPTTGRNPAMEILERQVDRDVQAQIQNQRNAQQNVANEQNMLQLMEDRLGDEVAAVDATKMAKYAWIRQQVEKKLQESTKQLPEGARQGEVTRKLAAMRQEVLGKEQDLRKAVNDRLMNVLTTDFQNRLRMAPQARAQEQHEFNMAAAMRRPSPTEGEGDPKVWGPLPGLPQMGFNLPEGSRLDFSGVAQSVPKELGEKASRAATKMRAVDRLLQMIDLYGKTPNIFDEKRNIMRRELASIQAAMVQDGPRMSDFDAKAIFKSIGPPDDPGKWMQRTLKETNTINLQNYAQDVMANTRNSFQPYVRGGGKIKYVPKVEPLPGDPGDPNAQPQDYWLMAETGASLDAASDGEITQDVIDPDNIMIGLRDIETQITNDPTIKGTAKRVKSRRVLDKALEKMEEIGTPRQLVNAKRLVNRIRVEIKKLEDKSVDEIKRERGAKRVRETTKKNVEEAGSIADPIGLGF